ncbi:phospholipase D-like domain-containing protein [Desulfotignum balticum]|uniref:phospholipase D-like domain-containing protein n=1 Tax=Desulfotignum balticum TaxID=115781 RepID=UPI00040854A5|nr:phospholipase D-like domain-containing protein [Desulfotignum balticum]
MSENVFYFILVQTSAIVSGILVLGSLGHMVYQRREPPSMIAWLLAIILLPYLAVPLYFILRSRKLTRREKTALKLAKRGEIPDHEATRIDMVLRNNGIAGATFGNRFFFYTDGVKAYNMLMDQIASARHTILISTYVLRSDTVGKNVLSALTRKASDGVQVKLLIDCIGSLPLYLYQWPLRNLKKAGGQVAFYMPLLARPFQNYINLRNHRKVFIFDDHTILSGGMNISIEYMGPSPCERRWDDILFFLQGPAVFHYREIFTEDWNHTAGEDLAMPDFMPVPIGDATIQVVPSGPDIQSDALYEALLFAVFSAQERIWIVTPYFVPDKSLMQALVIASHRGVDVKLITPAASNHLVADLSRSSFMRDLNARGVDVCLYQKGMIHAKAILYDRRGVIMGSANFDQRSLFLNYEVVSFAYSRPIIDQCEDWMTQLLADCTSHLPPPGRWRRLSENLMSVFAPLL